MEVYGIVWLSVDVHERMDVYGCLWMVMVACMCNGCLCMYIYIHNVICTYIYIYIYVCIGIWHLSAPVPQGPERGDGRYVFVCMEV